MLPLGCLTASLSIDKKHGESLPAGIPFWGANLLLNFLGCIDFLVNMCYYIYHKENSPEDKDNNWNANHLKMYLLLKKVIFHCHYLLIYVRVYRQVNDIPQKQLWNPPSFPWIFRSSQSGATLVSSGTPICFSFFVSGGLGGWSQLVSG